MRLLNASTRQLEEFPGRVPKYAILSHTWGPEEVSFKDITSNPEVESIKGYQKIGFACHQALQYDLQYVWCDTCCIDKSSSAELSEAINSMWNYYRLADMCFAYLDDIDRPRSIEPSEGGTRSWIEKHLHKCRWWSRGWTLQELIAPHILFFYDKFWKPLGSRDEYLLPLVHRITKIPTEIFAAGPELKLKMIKRYSIAKRMSWAASRWTTRVEDRAYCLMGIFDINMPLLYGEGKRAFQRLQEEIIKSSTDHSIFTFSRQLRTTLFATAPVDFYECGDIEACEPDIPMESYSMTNRGLLITLPVVRHIASTIESNNVPQIEVALNCQENGRLITLILQQLTKSGSLSDLPWEYTVTMRTPHEPRAESLQVFKLKKRTIVIVRDVYNARIDIGN